MEIGKNKDFKKKYKSKNVKGLEENKNWN